MVGYTMKYISHSLYLFTTRDKGVSHPRIEDPLSSLLQSIDNIVCKSFHAHHPVHPLPRNLLIKT